MSIISREFAACPARSAAETWTAIVNVLASNNAQIKAELDKVTGIAASIIADRVPLDSPITVIGSGPRLRIYCLYDEDATSDESKEDDLSWDLFGGDWQIHFPVEKSDIEWVQKNLKKKGNNFFAYQVGDDIDVVKTKANSKTTQLTINVEKLRSHG